MSAYMSDYVEDILSDAEVTRLRFTLRRAGYKVYPVPKNKWAIFGVEAPNGTMGCLYKNKYGTNKMPAEIYEYLEMEVRKQDD